MYILEHSKQLSQPFNTFHYGYEIFQTYQKTENYLDQVRYFAEECDNIQGFHLIADDSNAFSGMTSQVVK